MKWKPPKWLNKIPTGSHGSNPIQKRLWKLTSDYVRIHDFYRYRGACVSCSHTFSNWNDGQCGHFKSWGASNSYNKYNLKNLALQCSRCNYVDDGIISHRFAIELKRRHGDDVIDAIQKYDNECRGKKLDNIKLVKMALELLEKMGELEEQPSYYRQVIHSLPTE